MTCKKIDNMRLIQFILIFTLSINVYAQSDVPEKYWLDDASFSNIINSNSGFGDDGNETILIEFWAEFNAENCFADWEKIEGAKYYRVDIANSPNIKKQYRVRMAPTLILFKNGQKQMSFKAGLDLLLPTDLAEIQESINEINNANKF